MWKCECVQICVRIYVRVKNELGRVLTTWKRCSGVIET